MAERSVIWTSTAAKQRRWVLEYWLNRNKSAEYPKQLITSIAERIDVFSKFPEAGKRTEAPDIRVVAMGHFSIYYSFTDTTIFIKAFWDNRQDPKKLIKLLVPPTR
jgi:plasmid stabilization system protein ParE